MIVIMILIALLSGWGLLLLGGQDRSFHWAEQLSLSFVLGVSTQVIVSFVSGILFGVFSVWGSVLVCILILLCLFFRIKQQKIDLSDYFSEIRSSNIGIKQELTNYKPRKKVVSLAIVLYCITKVIMAFSINTHLPTFDEDAVAGWDIKSKVFAITHSIIGDKTSPEFWGSDLSRLPMAGLIDAYFLQGSDDLVGYTNIISPLVYLFSVLLIFGFLLRKSNSFLALLGAYLFCSLPFVFIHSFASYWNFATGFWLICITLLLLSQDQKSYSTGYLLVPIIICLSLIRNESLISIAIVISLYAGLLGMQHNKKRSLVILQKTILLPIMALLAGFVISKAIIWTYPAQVAMNTGGVGLSAGLIQKLTESLGNGTIAMAPFQQAFYHSDYNLLFLLYLLGLLFWGYSKYKEKNIVWDDTSYLTITSLVLIGLYLMALYINVQSLGLLTHFAFVRYPLGIILLITIVTMLNISNAYHHLDSKK